MIVFRNDFLELALLSTPARGFPKHSHDEYVISASLNGLESVWLDGKTFEADTATLTTYNPGEVQASRAVSDGAWRCLSLYVRPEAFEHYFHAPFEFGQPCVREAALVRELAAVAQSGSRVEEGCVALLGRLRSLAGSRPVTPPPSLDAARIRRVQQRLLDELAEAPSLEALAADEEVSPAHLVRSFHRQVGLPPRAWLIQQRLQLARRLLRSGTPIAEVALSAGFADQAHFSKAFARFSGMTPGQFRLANG